MVQDWLIAAASLFGGGYTGRVTSNSVLGGHLRHGRLL